jgi:hypothetical protein
VDSCSNVLFHGVMSDAIPQGLDVGCAYPVVGALEWDVYMPGSL